MAGVAKNYEVNSYENQFTHKVAENDLVTEQGDLISLASGFVTLAGAGDTIEGVSQTDKIFDADNETVSKEKVAYRKQNAKDTYMIKVNATSLADADIGSFFDIADTTQLVDYATKSATTGQVRLEKIVNTDLGIFTIVNL